MKMNRWGHKWVHLLVGLFILYTTPLSNIIAINHSVNHQLFADDIQLQKSAPLSEVTNPTKELNACTDNIKTWITKNQLKLNDNKTEALLFSFSSSLTPSTVFLPGSVTLGSHNIPFSDFARNLGFILVSKLSLKKHIIKICQTAYFELKCISSVHMFLTEDAAKTLVTSSIPSLLDYCNCLFMVHLILSSILSKKFKTVPSDLFFWHPVTTTQHLHSISHTTLFFWHPHAKNPTIPMQNSWLLHLLLCWTTHLKFTPTRP